jgi:hypothetical protein
LKIYRADAANALISSSANEPNEFEWRNPSDSFFFYQSTLTTFRADRPANQSAYCRSSKGKTFVCLDKTKPCKLSAEHSNGDGSKHKLCPKDY